jgi:hypothetical protein
MINEKRRLSDAAAGIAKQMAIFFDGRPGVLETSVATNDVGE